MKNKENLLDSEELELLNEIQNGEWKSKPLSEQERKNYQNDAKYTKSLQEKNRRLLDFLLMIWRL